MRKVSSLLGISILLGACCFAQSPREALDFLTQLRSASQTQNADAYAALFDSNGKWDGPIGQNAIGPLNIRSAALQFFTEFGALQFVAASAAQLSPDLVMADLYQTTDGPHVSPFPKLIARGSGTPPPHADVRTTLILHKQESGWRIIAARVADLRVRNSR